MAKKFMYVCFGILALAVAFHLGARYGNASIVDHSTTGIVAVSGNDVLLDNGEVWRNHAGTTNPLWSHLIEYDLPVPVSQVKFWDRPICFYTTDNEIWYYDNGEWHNYGAPGGVMSTQSTTWGEIKAEFGERG
jgi:hypothetical protein